MSTNKIITLLLAVSALFSCQNESSDLGETPSVDQIYAKTNLYPTPPEKWMGETNPYFTAGYVGDVMPYYENGKFHLYFLHDAKTKPAGEGFHDIHSFETTDFINYQYNGRQIPYGKSNEADFGVGTGSLIKYNNTYYYYYTGHNGSGEFLQKNPRESVLLATSTDLKNWTKVSNFKITAPPGYYNFEFRDPHVFFNNEDGKYWMLISAQKEGSRQAVILKMTAANPQSGNWVSEGDLYTSSENYIMMECPDMFKMGNYWYLLFSENWSASSGMHYRIATSPNGPWKTPENDRLDGSFLYAAKTASDNTNRFLFGWTARRAPENNTGGKEWAGNLVIHQITQNADGTLAVKQPDNINTVFSKNTTLAVDKTSGSVSQNNNNFTLSKDGMVVFTALKKANYIDFDIKLGNSGETGVILAHNTEAKSGVKITFEPEKNRLATYTLNAGTEQFINSYPVDLKTQDLHKVSISISNDVCIMYVDRKIAYTNRVYGINGEKWSIFSNNNQSVYSNITIKNPK